MVRGRTHRPDLLTLIGAVALIVAVLRGLASGRGTPVVDRLIVAVAVLGALLLTVAAVALLAGAAATASSP